MSLTRKSIKVVSLLFILFSVACDLAPPEDMVKARISAVCRAQKQFLKKNRHYGSLDELTDAELITWEPFQTKGYKTDIKLTETGYFATVIPNNVSTIGMFYVDEKGVIKNHPGDTNTQADDPLCRYPNGAKCTCYDE